MVGEWEHKEGGTDPWQGAWEKSEIMTLSWFSVLGNSGFVLIPTAGSRNSHKQVILLKARKLESLANTGNAWKQKEGKKPPRRALSRPSLVPVLGCEFF